MRVFLFGLGFLLMVGISPSEARDGAGVARRVAELVSQNEAFVPLYAVKNDRVDVIEIEIWAGLWSQKSGWVTEVLNQLEKGGDTSVILALKADVLALYSKTPYYSFRALGYLPEEARLIIVTDSGGSARMIHSNPVKLDGDLKGLATN
jgi:hypothetical protein